MAMLVWSLTNYDWNTNSNSINSVYSVFGTIKGVKSMNDEILEIMNVCIDLVCVAKQLVECDDGCGADFSDVLTDLKWSRMTLNNRLMSLKE